MQSRHPLSSGPDPSSSDLELLRRHCREAYISTKQPSSQSQARLPRSDEHSRRSCRAQVTPRQGPRPTLGLIDRIREREAFVRLRRDGVRVRMGPLWCSYVHDPHMTSTQVAFSIGKPVGNAVVRNRLRRQAKDILSRLELPSGLVLIGARPESHELTFAQLSETLESLMDLAAAKVVAS